MNNENRFEGKGVGPNGGFTLFWDHTFNLQSTLLQGVGDINPSSTNFNEYPFVEAGRAPDYTQSYSHTTLLHDGTTAAAGANRQMVWAMDGFKSGGQGAGIKNPYIDYNSNFWFGHYTSGNQITPNYSSLNNNGESLGSKLEHMVQEMMLVMYINGGPTQRKVVLLGLQQ